MKTRALPFTALASLTVVLLAGPAFAQTRRIERRYTVTGKPVIILQTPSGRIHVKAWNRNEVVVLGQYAGGRVLVESEQVDNRVEVFSRPVGPASPSPSEARADFEISVPAEAELQVRTDSGNVTVESVHGDMSFDTVAADLVLQDVQGYLVIKSIGGSLLCTRCGGRLDATSISGSLRIMQPLLHHVRLQTSSGNILFDGAFVNRGIYVMKNYSGTIEVRFSDQDSFDVRAASLYGNVINEATVVQDKTRAQAPRSSLARSLLGSVNSANQGQAKVELSSFNGTIKLLKRE
jgi:DUF4097 and DUF4098 domain-containing protein YvlB